MESDVNYLDLTELGQREDRSLVYHLQSDEQILTHTVKEAFSKYVVVCRVIRLTSQSAFVFLATHLNDECFSNIQDHPMVSKIISYDEYIKLKSEDSSKCEPTKGVDQVQSEDSVMPCSIL